MKLFTSLAAAFAVVFMLATSAAIARADCLSSLSALNRVDLDEAALGSFAQAHHGRLNESDYHRLSSDLRSSAAATRDCRDVHARDAYNVADLTRWYAGAGAGFEFPATAARQMRVDLVSLQRQGYGNEDADAFALYVGETMQVYDVAHLAWLPLPKPPPPLTTLSRDS